MYRVILTSLFFLIAMRKNKDVKITLYITHPRKHYTMPTNQCVTHELMQKSGAQEK